MPELLISRNAAPARVQMPQIKRRPVVVHLADGPCAGTFAKVLSHGNELYQRLGPRQQVWCRYVKNLFVPGEYVWSGEAVTTWQHAAMIKNDTENTYGESYGGA